jgi:hypothetical protein
MHPLWLLAFATFILIAGAAIWSLVSTKRRHEQGPNVEGLGGRNDPMA